MMAKIRGCVKKGLVVLANSYATVIMALAKNREHWQQICTRDYCFPSNISALEREFITRFCEEWREIKLNICSGQAQEQIESILRGHLENLQSIAGFCEVGLKQKRMNYLCICEKEKKENEKRGEGYDNALERSTALNELYKDIQMLEYWHGLICKDSD